MGQPMVLGLAFLTVSRSAEEILRAEGRSLQDGYSAALRGAFDRGINPRHMYPIEWYRDLFAATGDQPELHERLGRLAIDHDLRSGVYRFLLRVLAPHTVFAVAPRLFANYYSEGNLEIHGGGPGRLAVHWERCTGFDGPLWRAIEGSGKRVLELAGAQGLVWERVEGGGDTDDGMICSARWDTDRPTVRAPAR